MIKNNLDLAYELDKYPEDARLCTTYSDDVESGCIEVVYDKETNTIQIIGSTNDV